MLERSSFRVYSGHPRKGNWRTPGEAKRHKDTNSVEPAVEVNGERWALSPLLCKYVIICLQLHLFPGKAETLGSGPSPRVSTDPG